MNTEITAAQLQFAFYLTLACLGLSLAILAQLFRNRE